MSESLPVGLGHELMGAQAKPSIPGALILSDEARAAVGTAIQRFIEFSKIFDRIMRDLSEDALTLHANDAQVRLVAAAASQLDPNDFSPAALSGFRTLGLKAICRHQINLDQLTVPELGLVSPLIPTPKPADDYNHGTEADQYLKKVIHARILGGSR